MIGIAKPCPLFTKMVDRLAPISISQAAALKDAGVGAVARYVETLTPAEIEGLFKVGLGVLPLSKAPAGPLSATSGRSHATAIIQRASMLGVPENTHVMIDLEAQQGAVSDVTAYDNELSQEITIAGYIVCAYIGADQPLTSAQLFALPHVHLYWRGGSLGIPEPRCGFAIWQVPPLEQMIAGSVVDVSITGADERGRRPVLWYPS